MTHERDRSPESPHGRPSGAIERRVLEDSARAVARARELQNRVRAVADGTPTLEERAVAIVDEALETLGASVGIAMRRTTDGDALELIGAAHLPDDLGEQLHYLAIDAPLPAAEVARTGQAFYCESRQQLLDRFPATRELVELLGVHAMAALPIRDVARLQGSVVFGFPASRTFTTAEKSSLRVLASRYARALRDARRFYAEHDARTAEAAARRAAEEARTVAEDARTVAEATARVQGDYLAVVSHELRTPLQAIVGYADLLAGGVVGELAPQQREFATRIAASGVSLLQIVENLLGFSAAQIGRQRVDVTEFDLCHVVREVTTLSEPLAARKGIDVRAEMPELSMRSDARKVQQILTNLVGNAIKFTDHGEVVVSAVVAEAKTPNAAVIAPASVRLAVRDTGRGIPTTDLPHLFEPFWQGAAGGTNGASGTGLGLSIVRQLALLLGGDVDVESTPDEGSTFTVTLPLVAPNAPLTPSPTP